MRVTLNSKADNCVALISGLNCNLECWFLWRGETRKPREKLSEQGREPTTDSTRDAGSGNQTRTTAVGGERSHHCVIPASSEHVLEHVHVLKT